MLTLSPMLDLLHTSTTISSLEATELENLLSYLNQVHQVDLTGYKRSTLMRRTLLRMRQVGVEHYQGYLDYLQQHLDEVTHLLDTIFINFTYFLRDRPVWDHLASQIIPQLIASKAPDEPIRVWSAGCASGEETYSLAMLLIEALGVKQFQQRVSIYGTDVDADAIVQAHTGYYPAHKVEAIPAAWQEKYFERKNGDYCWRQDLYGSVSFHLHNLMQNPPLPQIDLLVCRNLLMYFTAETKLQVLASFYSSLQDNGFLLLGNVESLVTHSERSLFMPFDRPSRIFTKVPDAYKSNLLLPLPIAPMSVCGSN